MPPEVGARLLDDRDITNLHYENSPGTRKKRIVASVTELMASRVTPLYFCFSSSPFKRFARNLLPISAQIPNPLLTAGMLSLCHFNALALLGLALPAITAPSPQLKELESSFVVNEGIIQFDPNYYIPIKPFIPADPILKAQIDGFNLASSLEFSSPTEPITLVQISDQGVFPNPDHGNSVVDPDIEAGGTCRKTKNLYCCKGQYSWETQKVAQPCKICTLPTFSALQLLYFCSNHIILKGRTEEAIFCSDAKYYCCHDLDVGSLSSLSSVE